jgi:hypothetical protein
MNALHTQAMVQTLRYTGLRIGDVAMMARDRITRDPRTAGGSFSARKNPASQ